MSRLRSEFKRAGKNSEFERLKTFLTADKKEIPYAKTAEELGMTESALRVAATQNRLSEAQRRCGELQRYLDEYRELFAVRAAICMRLGSCLYWGGH